MEYNELIDYTVMKLEDEHFENLKASLVDRGYINFLVLDDSEITKAILSEKICDYFEKVELKTLDPLDKQVKNFCRTLDTIVSGKVLKVTKANPNPSRARRYYEHVKELPRKKDLTIGELMDYSRVMFCLYNAIIENQGVEITNFDYRLSTINTTNILGSLIKEQNNFVKQFKGMFESKEEYTSERGILVLAIIILNKLLANRIFGDYYHD